jgi:beta-glucanase (GH16 family)
MVRTIFFTILFLIPYFYSAQTVEDNFEGNGTISWQLDPTQIIMIDVNFSNPFQNGINNSSTVLKYDDDGSAPYANIRFNTPANFDLSAHNTFSLKIYIPSNGISGNQTNQISLKLQDGSLGEPWVTQTEIIKPVVLNQWQEITFSFGSDAYLPASPDPITRTDFNRVVLQVNGENNNDSVIAYIDDFLYDGIIDVPVEPVFDDLVWSDEFDGSGAINSANWFHQTQLPAGGSWYNGEVQHYTNREDNSYLDNGLMHIIAKKETFHNQGYTKQYTSARLNSKFAFTYGRVEVRAKLPTGVGTWPAIWMLGKNINEDGGYWDNQGFGNLNWPACGEIDIMEHWGHNQNYVQSAMHTPSSYGGTLNHGGQTIPSVSNEFHVYTLEWSSEKMVFSVNDVVHYTYNPSTKDSDTWPFDSEQYLLLNIAIQPSIEQSFTQSAMEIDYVRVYQESVLAVSEEANSNKIKFYPNPVKNKLNINLGNISNQEVELQIVDICGRTIYNNQHLIKDNKISYSTAALNSGLYFIKLNFNNGTTNSFKFIKN